MSLDAQTPRGRGRKNRARDDNNTRSPSTTTVNNNNVENRDAGDSTSKKRTIFHYFAGVEATTAPGPEQPGGAASGGGDKGPGVGNGGNRYGSGRDGGDSNARKRYRQSSKHERRDASTETVPQPCGLPGFDQASLPSSEAPSPSWGKLIDPRKQQRWKLLRRVQEGWTGAGGIDSTAWARRSYSLSYAPVFQDGRTPGMGSTSGVWGWTSQSHVFGGTRACLTTEGPVATRATHGVARELMDGRGGGHEQQHTDHDVVVDERKEDSSDRRVFNNGGGGGDVEIEDLALAQPRLDAAKTRGQLQSRNFGIMFAWLSSSRTASACPSSATEVVAAGAAAATTTTAPQQPCLTQSFLEVALARRDGDLVSALTALASMAPRTMQGAGEKTAAGDTAEDHGPVVLALALYHARSTWRRVRRHPAPRGRGNGPGSRLHPDDPVLASVVDEADAVERERRSRAEFDSALTLLNAGFAVSLVDAAGASSANGDDDDGGGGIFDAGRGGGCGGGGGWGWGDRERDPDPLVVLATGEALTAAETRALTKNLGVQSFPGQSSSDVRWNGKANSGHGRRSNGRGGGRLSHNTVGGGGGGGGERSSVEGKEDACNALEHWLLRPKDAAKRKARVARMARQAAFLISGGRRADRRGVRDRSGGGGSDDKDGNAGDVVVLRLADDAREAIHRVHVAFFAAARHAPHDVPAVLREELARVSFGGAGDIGGRGGGEEGRCADGDNTTEADHGRPSSDVDASADGRSEVASCSSHVLDSLTPSAPHRGGVQRYTDGSAPSPWDNAARCMACDSVAARGELRRLGSDASGGMEEGYGEAQWGWRPAPQILSSVEAFAEYYRLVTLAEAMEFAAGAGDSGLAYGSLHEASTALLPSGCPLCRRHELRRCAAAGSAAIIGNGVGTGKVPEEQGPPLPHCDICELSARVVMRGAGLMEREKDYDNVFHYLRIFLKAPSQRLSVYRPRYWLRLVTDLGHRKRTMEALRVCEDALAEEAASIQAATTTAATASAKDEVQPSSPSVEGEFRSSEEAVATRTGTGGATILPLCESLPLLRRAVRLAVPPLRWRRRAPPQLKEARLRVMRLDLSWRRSSGVNDKAVSGKGGGYARGGARNPRGNSSPPSSSWTSSSTVVKRKTGPSGGDPAMSPSGVGVATPLAKKLEEEKEEDKEGLRREIEAVAVGDGIGDRKTIAPGTSLEQAVLDTMLAELGPEWTGLHAENSICLGLFALLCWDALFAPVLPAETTAATAAAAAKDPPWGVDGGCPPEADQEDVFYRPFPSPYQSEPADLMTVAFAGRRRRQLEAVYAIVERGDASERVRLTWSRHYGKACTGLNWNLFPDGVEGWVTVACAIGPLPLSHICRNLASNYWAWRHGLADLFLWRKDAAAPLRTAAAVGPPAAHCSAPEESNNPAKKQINTSALAAAAAVDGGLSCPVIIEDETVGSDGKTGDESCGDSGSTGGVAKREAGCKWVEVKGPGDSLSCAQEAWIDTLVRAGADAVLLRVEDAAATPVSR